MNDQKILAEVVWVTKRSLENYFIKCGLCYLPPTHCLYLSKSPVISCESPSTLFRIGKMGEYFLPQTQQLILERALLTFPKGIFSQTISYRNEVRENKRHLAAFNLFEFEFPGTFQDLLEMIAQMIIRVVRDILNECKNIDNANLLRLSRVVGTKSFPRLTYDKALSILKSQNVYLDWGQDINSKCEQTLLRYFHEKPFLLIHHPSKIKFFNMMVNPKKIETVLSCDLILPFGGETIGAARRENDSEKLIEQLYRTELWKWAIQKGFHKDLRKYINIANQLPAHSGGGIGMERLVQFILGINDIRKVGGRHDLFE